uniref:Reverse transcriptase domain-containing protein n=1 Tax=Bracon brevicornis TaxID=1563983 RepID=A0A6V7JQF2_9HYME
MLLLFDFSKVFDSVCHTFLLTKLLNLDFSLSAIHWIASYLASRSQAVSDGSGSLYFFCPLNKGVAEGSVLGPLLFLLYINDVGEALPPGVSHLTYADDFQVYFSFIPNSLDEAKARMSRVADGVAVWVDENRLRLKVEKTEAAILSSQAFVNKAYASDDFVFGVRIDEHITPYREMFGWLRGEERRKYFLGCLVYKVLPTTVLI